MEAPRHHRSQTKAGIVEGELQVQGSRPPLLQGTVMQEGKREENGPSKGHVEHECVRKHQACGMLSSILCDQH